MRRQSVFDKHHRPAYASVPRRSKLKSAEDLWRKDVIEEPLIRLPATEMITRVFQKGLQQRKIDWPHTIEASSVGLVTRYVANGYGVGVSVAASEAVKHKDVRVLPLEDFDSIEIALLSNGKPTPLVEHVLEACRQVVAKEWPKSQRID